MFKHQRFHYSFRLLGLTLVAIELISYVTGLVLQERRMIPLQPIPVAQNYQEYLSTKDELIGWPSPTTFGNNDRDITGSRHIPSFDNPKRYTDCISLYGDSFTFAAEVDHKHAWSNLLSQLLNCRIANYGVSGFGTDQAYLRFYRNNTDKAKISILGHHSMDIIRNLSRNLYFAEKNVSRYSLKPRFILDKQGNLKLVPIPQLSERKYRQMVGLESPQFVLEHENFYPGGPTGIEKFQFPYSYALFKNINNYRIRALLARKPGYMEFYTKNHPLKGLEITKGIIQSFFQEAKQRGKQPLIIIFPSVGDLKFYKKSQQWSYENLMEVLNAENIPFLNFGSYLLKCLGERNVEEVFIQPDVAYHNEEGNRVIAEFIYAYINKNRSMFTH